METADETAGRHAENLFAWLASPLIIGAIVFLGTSLWSCQGFLSPADNGLQFAQLDPSFGKAGVIGGPPPSCERVLPFLKRRHASSALTTRLTEASRIFVRGGVGDALRQIPRSVKVTETVSLRNYVQPLARAVDDEHRWTHLD
jgi:hypothetical protein